MYVCSARTELTGSGLYLCLVGLIMLVACGEPVVEEPQPRTVSINYLETGDLDAIVKRGRLRILLLSEAADDSFLPRAGSMQDFELRTASAFARSLGLEPVIVYVDRVTEFIPALREGRGDLIAANLSVTDERKALIEFTVPLLHARQVVLRRKGDELSKRKQLNGRSIAIRQSTPYWTTASSLTERYKELQIQPLGEDLTDDQKFEMLADGAIDLTIHDDVGFAVAAHYHDEIEMAFPVTREQPVAWGIRKQSVQLKDALDRFLTLEQLTRAPGETHTDDFAGIKQRRTLRVVTRNNAASYFLWRGELLGFEYEMAKAFAKEHRLRLEVLVAPSWERMLPMLLEGEADIAAAFLTPSDNRRALGVQFSRPYSTASEVVVTRSDDERLQSLEDLAGRVFTVRESSSYWQTLAPLAQQYGFTLRAAPEDEETETIIARVADGEYDLTLADSNIIDIELTWRSDVRAAMPIGDPIHHGWAVRAQNTELLTAVNRYLKKQYRSAFYNLTYAKYFTSESRIRQHKEERVDLNAEGEFSPYDDIVKRYAEQYGFDWRLLVAQMYQESRFDPQARSWAGAHGLMQVLPRTAKQMGFEGDLSDPEHGIHAGIKYLAWMRERFDPELPVLDRMWLTLAAYNAGREHLRDARVLARRMGWKSNRWFGNVEQAMLLLSKKKYARKARFGYVRGHEPVNYVREIKLRYDAYVRYEEILACRTRTCAPSK
jgi:membrane-bound lytic murein transglycosylase F